MSVTQNSIAITLALLIAGLAPAEARQSPRPPFEALRSLMQLDANADQAISRGEVPEAAREAFDTLLRHGDADGNGQLAGEEIRGLLERLRSAGSGANPRTELRRRLERADRDGDGSISRAEFPGPAAMFDRLDLDRDGLIKPEDLRRGGNSSESLNPTRREVVRPRPLQRLDASKESAIAPNALGRDERATP